MEERTLDRATILLQNNENITPEVVAGALELMLLPQYVLAITLPNLYALVSREDFIAIMTVDFKYFSTSSIEEAKDPKNVPKGRLICIDCPEEYQKILKQIDADKCVFLDSNEHIKIEGIPKKTNVSFSKNGKGQMPYGLLINLLKSLDLMPEKKK